MPILDSIQQAQSQGANPDEIVNEIIRQNPQKAGVFQQARSKGADSQTILDEVVKQNTPITPKEPTGFFEKLKADLARRAEATGVSLDRARGGQQGIASAALQTAGQGAGFGLDILGRAQEAATPKFLQDILSQGTQGAINLANMAAGTPISAPTPENLGVKSPTTKANLEAAGNIAMLAPVVTGAMRIAPKLASAARGGASDALSTIKSKFSPKTEEQILATPEKKLPKLSPQERDLYFQKQNERLNANFQDERAKITQKSVAAEDAAKKNLQATTEKLQAESKQLQTEVHQASADKVIELRPKIVQKFGEQSAEYRQLADKEIAGHASIKIASDDLRSFIETQFTEQGEAQSIIRTLGIPESGETTIGRIYKQSVKLGQDIGTAAKKGSRVYTQGELLTDKSIHALVDFMKTQGVDLSEARQFWRNWAPLRDEIIRTAKPFNRLGTETSNLAGKLTEVAGGASKSGVNNANFIKEVEKLLGEPVTGETRAGLAKLNQNEMQAIATKVEAEAEQAQIALDRELKLKDIAGKKLANQQALKSIRFQAEQKARHRAIIKRIIQGTIAAGTVYEAGKRGVLSGVGL